MVPRRLLQAEQPEPRPVVQTLALRPGAQAAPALQRFGRRQILGRHLDRPLAGDQRPQRRLDRQHMGPLVLFQPDAQPTVVALVAQHPGDRHPGREGIMRCASRGLVANSMSSGTAVQRSRSIPWADTAHGRSGHGPGHWRRPGKHRSDSSRPVPQSPTRRAAKQILARHAGRPGSLLQEPGLVDDQHAVRRAQVLDHITAAQVTRLVLVPQDMRQNPLGAPRAAVPDRFGQLPAVLALGRAPSRYRPT